MATMSSAASHSVPAATKIPTQQNRLISLDVYRGLTIAGMLLVTNAGSWDHVYWPLRHADWNGATPTDMIFPSFLFIAGVSLVFSFAARLRRGATTTDLVKHVITRSLLLIVLGLLLNGFPDFDWHNVRIPGILQRIGLCNLGTGLLYLALIRTAGQTRRVIGWVAAAIVASLTVYWALMKLVSVPGFGAGRLDQVGSLEAWIDRALFGTNHLWLYGGQTWDPEGMLSTIPATCNMLLGIIAGEWLRSARPEGRKLVALAASGAILMLAGWALNPMIPINKKIWTPAFMLLSGGFSLLALALLSWVIDQRGWKKGTTPALIFGSNAILAFALATMLNSLEPKLRFHDAAGKLETTHEAVFNFLGGFLSPNNASLGYALLFVSVNCIVVFLFYRKRIFLKL